MPRCGGPRSNRDGDQHDRVGGRGRDVDADEANSLSGLVANMARRGTSTQSPALLARLERLEAVLKPSGRAFVLVWRASKDGPLAEREAEYRAEHGVGPYDTLVTVIIRSERRGTEYGTTSHAQSERPIVTIRYDGHPTGLHPCRAAADPAAIPALPPVSRSVARCTADQQRGREARARGGSASARRRHWPTFSSQYPVNSDQSRPDALIATTRPTTTGSLGILHSAPSHNRSLTASKPDRITTRISWNENSTLLFWFNKLKISSATSGGMCCAISIVKSSYGAILAKDI